MERKGNNLLEVENLKVHFFTKRGVVKAVDGVSFSLSPGEVFGLVGESGCGKTVTGLSLLRLVPEPAGRIVGGKIIFEGQDLLKKSLSEMRKIRGAKISMILQDPLTSLNPAFTIGNQVGEAIELHQGVRGKALWDKVVESLRLVRIPDAESRVRYYPHMMSGGMRQRVSGAIALSCRPSLLIADEPTTSLDVTVQAQYLRLLKELQERNKTSMIFITHDFGILARMCDRVAIMYAGRIVETAEIREIFNNPLHPYTKALIGCLPKMDQKLQRLITIEGQLPRLSDLPPGCRFAPRCPEVSEECYQEYPPQRILGRGHNASCWHAGERYG